MDGGIKLVKTKSKVVVIEGYIISDPKILLNVLTITNRYNICGSGTIDYEVGAHTLNTHKTSSACQESTTRNLQQ